MFTLGTLKEISIQSTLTEHLRSEITNISNIMIFKINSQFYTFQNENNDK